MDDQGIIKNNTSTSDKKLDDGDNDTKKNFGISPILVMLKPGETKPRYFEPITIEDPAIENIIKESEGNVLRRRKVQEDNNTPKGQATQSPFFELLMQNLKHRLDTFDKNKDFQTSDIFSLSDLEKPNFQYSETPKMEDKPSDFHNRVLKNYGEHLDTSRNRTNREDDIYGINKLLESRRKFLKDMRMEDFGPYAYHPPVIPEYKPFDYGQIPVFEPPKVNIDSFQSSSHRVSRSGVWFVSVVAFAIIMFILKLIARPRPSRSERRRQREREQQAPVTAPTSRPRNNSQRRRRRDQQNPASQSAPQLNEPYGSLARLVNSDYSAESSEADLPPTYAECATNNHEIVNVHVVPPKTLITDEPPPPYSACLDILPNTENNLETHKSQINIHLQSSSVINSNDSNLVEASSAVDAGQSNTNETRFSTNGTVGTTIIIINENLPETRNNNNVPQ